MKGNVMYTVKNPRIVSAKSEAYNDRMSVKGLKIGVSLKKQRQNAKVAGQKAAERDAANPGIVETKPKSKHQINLAKGLTKDDLKKKAWEKKMKKDLQKKAEEEKIKNG